METTHIKVLAERLLTDIRHRGLSVGDRYLTTEEVSQALGVGKGTAGKAIRHLAQQEILISRQRSGTYVGPGVSTQKRSNVQGICVLLPSYSPSATHWAYQPCIAGIRSAIPGSMVQFAFVPEADPVSYVRELIDSSRASGQFAGVISVSCPFEIYQYLAELNAPAMVYGSLQASELAITSMDSDNFESGRLLAQYLIDQGHRRIGFSMAGGSGPGDNLFFDGIIDALSTANLPPSALVLRLVRNGVEALQVTAKEMLQDKNRPTAIITRGSYQVEALATVASSMGMSVPNDLEIVFDHENETTPCIDTALYPRVEPKLSFFQIAEMFGQTLKGMMDGSSSKPQRIVIPVELHEPRRVKNK